MKRWIRFGAIVAVIAAMVVALVVLQSDGDDADDAAADTPAPGMEDDPGRVPLFENPRDEIESITLDTGTSEITLERTDGDEFLPVYEHDVEFDSRRIGSIVRGASSLTSRRVIGEVDDPSEFGLADPAIVVTVLREDGERRQISVGGRTPSRDAYYVMRPGDENVYTVYNSWINPFFSTLDALRVRTIPEITVEEFRELTLETLEGRTIRVEPVPEWDTDPELDLSRYIVTEPFDRRFQVSSNWLQDEIVGPLSSLKIGEFVDDDPDDLSDYGLEPPLARLQIADEDTELELLVGRETGSGRFAKFAETPSVFIVNGVEPIVATDPFDSISAFALIVNIDLVDSFVIEAPNATYTGRIERTPVEGEEEPEEAYYLNDREIDEDLFKDLYQWAIGLQFDAEIPAGQSWRRDGRRLATITYQLNSEMGELTVTFPEHNANYAAVVRDGEAEFLISRLRIERMLDAFEEASASAP
ncbi:MAG: DUF4340 domain-containing protein [Spirochaetota bacterium]